MNQLKQYWKNLPNTEQKKLLIGAGVISILLFFVIVWFPLSNKINNLDQQLTSNKQVLNSIQTLDSKINNLEQKAKSKTSKRENLLVLLQTELNSFQLNQLQPKIKQVSDKTVRIQFQRVEFDRFIRFLTKLWQTYRVSIHKINIQRTETPGLVQIQCTLITT